MVQQSNPTLEAAATSCISTCSINCNIDDADDDDDDDDDANGGDDFSLELNHDFKKSKGICMDISHDHSLRFTSMIPLVSCIISLYTYIPTNDNQRHANLPLL